MMVFNNNDKLLETAEKFIQEHNMIQKNDIICCALSGGADSVCLLLCLLELRKSYDFILTAVHINHQLRGDESLRDVHFCESLCKFLNVPLQVVTCDVTGYAEKNKCSIETAARKCRYDAFESQKADKIATAHTASDNLETFIHRFIRGSGLKGLTSIPPVRGKYIRPLLCITREQIENYIQIHNQDFVTDSTNLTDEYTRNKIRHNIIPLCKEINKSVEHTSIGMLSALRSEQEYLNLQAQEAFNICLKDKYTLSGLSDFHIAIQRRCIIMFLENNNLSYDSEIIDILLSLYNTGGKYNISGDIYVIGRKDSISVVTIPKEKNTVRCELNIGINQIFPHFFVEALLIRNETYVKNTIIHKKSTKILLDYDKIKGHTILRSRVFGDKIQLSGRNFTSSVKKLIQSDVPVSRRNTVHFLADDMGTIFVEFCGIAERVKPDENTKTLLEIKILEDENGYSDF